MVLGSKELATRSLYQSDNMADKKKDLIDSKRNSLKIAVLLSGGVDSSVALSLLQLTRDWGHEVKAFYLKIWLQDEFMKLGDCPWEEDLDYAEKVCSQFNIPLEVVSLQKDYWQDIVEVSIKEVRRGHTPNPDMYCNSKIKFGLFVDKIGKEYHYVASGHYARLLRFPVGKMRLCLGRDEVKDQSYFLSYLTPIQLCQCLFPLGALKSVGELGLESWMNEDPTQYSQHLEKIQEKYLSLFSSVFQFNFAKVWEKGFSKPEVRDLARYFGLPNQKRKDSQGVCFLGKIRFSEFIRYHLGESPGEIIEHETGKVLGTHSGYWYYTIGQRQGLKLSGGPWYVVQKDIPTNRIFISRREPEVFNSEVFKEFKVTDINWLEETEEEFYCEVKVRHGKKTLPARLIKIDKFTCKIHLSVPDCATATGQFAVFYKERVCLGAGIINF